MLINDPSRSSFWGSAVPSKSAATDRKRAGEALFSPGRVEISENQRKSIRCVFTQERAPCALLEENSENLLPDTDQKFGLIVCLIWQRKILHSKNLQRRTLLHKEEGKSSKFPRFFTGKTNNTHLLFLLQLVLLFCAPERERERKREGVLNSLATCIAHVETKRSSWHP